MDKVMSITTPEQKNKKNIMMVAGIIMIVASIPIAMLPATIFGLVVLYLSLYKKNIIINKESYMTNYNFLIKKSTIKYDLKEFQTVLIDEKGDFSRLGFIKNGVTSYGFFNSRDVDAIIDLFKSRNPNINIQYIQLKSKFGQ